MLSYSLESVKVCENCESVNEAREVGLATLRLTVLRFESSYLENQHLNTFGRISITLSHRFVGL